MRTRAISSVALATLLVFVPPALAQQADALESGRAIYLRECASCHGDAATGYGPAARLLIHPPADLTLFRDRDTPFPRGSIANVITGRIRLEPSHGFSQMPKWRDLPGLDALLAYLESIQLRKYGPYQGPTPGERANSGARLYAEHCTACHGADGKGTTPAVLTVGISPPDLTTMSSRYEGFYVDQVFEAIARCHDDDDTGMPSWRRAFERFGWPAALISENLEALTRYLETMQRP